MISRTGFTEGCLAVRRRFLNFLGIISKQRAYKGPDVVQIDLTDKCNNSCVCCWCHSPEIANRGNVAFDELDFGVFKGFLSEIRNIGSREIYFSGGGEPFMYPGIWDALELAEKTGLSFRINTNFTLLDKGGIRRLAGFRNLRSLSVSVWAHEPDLYSRIHGRNRDVFLELKDNIRYLNSIKPSRIKTRLFCLINNLNYPYLKEMVGLAREAGSDEIEFSCLDAIPGSTDHFLLSSSQLYSLQRDFRALLGKPGEKQPGVKIACADIFLRRISSIGAASGRYDSYCEDIPCFAGWVFLRLRANGDLNSCLKSHRKPIGNIYKQNVSSVWNGPLQQEFRSKCLTLPRDKEYFGNIGNGLRDKGIGCSRVCDNVITNEHIYNLLKNIALFR